ncbi:MAG: acyl-CoA thioesterase [Campylobacter sp.]|nr:acyl-CoA thioesterase [Campylobacter sp.]
MKNFYYKIKVGKEAIDINNHANNAYYFVWMQEVANAHSMAVGDDIAKNLANGKTWMARRNEIEYISQLFLGDEVEIHTWTQPEKKTSSKRHFEFIKDGKIIAKAITTYIFFDINRSRPIAIPEEIAKLYED